MRILRSELVLRPIFTRGLVPLCMLALVRNRVVKYDSSIIRLNMCLMHVHMYFNILSNVFFFNVMILTDDH